MRLMRREQAPLNIASTNVKLFSKLPNDHQKLMPVIETKPNSAGIFCDSSHPIQKLPDTDIEDAVTAGI